MRIQTFIKDNFIKDFFNSEAQKYSQKDLKQIEKIPCMTTTKTNKQKKN